jgi:hypothetical protein
MHDLFCELRDRLKRAYPDLVVSVLRCRVPRGIGGDCVRIAGDFRIRVSSGVSIQEQLDTLVHEWAHVVAWQEWELTGSHGKAWAAAYAEAYRIYESVISGQ